MNSTFTIVGNPVVQTRPHEILEQVTAHATEELGFPVKSLVTRAVSQTTVYAVLEGQRPGISLDHGIDILRQLPPELQVVAAQSLFPLIDHCVKAKAGAASPPCDLQRATDACVAAGREHQDTMEAIRVAAADGAMSASEQAAILTELEQAEAAIRLTREVVLNVPVQRQALKIS